LKLNSTFTAEIDEDGNLVLPPEIKQAIGLTPGATVRVETGEDGVRIIRPRNNLARVYVEPTNRCNLECRTCIRNVWDEPIGLMEPEVFEQILEGVQAFSPIPTVFLGGFGEPLVHPQLVEMVRQVKRLGGKAELITNGILLSEEISSQLIETGLDVLWIPSMASPQKVTPMCAWGHHCNSARQPGYPDALRRSDI
jgi:bifunctional DNA-binding transcriptional regulator/antitoxin component of YhaV-PrlF toxin-antitoxin module